ncbi:hypothetical protein [Nonomuraea salmonea]|uniref:hypothetical protein n=1 Tax=Nonomuraea salmonea TaxID=46181 RepID=UPI002FE7DA34
MAPTVMTPIVAASDRMLTKLEAVAKFSYLVTRPTTTSSASAPISPRWRISLTPRIDGSAGRLAFPARRSVAGSLITPPSHS